MGTWGELVQKYNRFEAEIQGFDGDVLLHERFIEMGLLHGAHLRVLGQAPFRGPWIVQLNTTLLALRNEEAQCLRLKYLKNL